MADDVTPEEASERAAHNGGFVDGDLPVRPPEPVNRYARDKRVQCNHRPYETFVQDLRTWQVKLEVRGWPSAHVSQNELMMAILDAGMPRTIDEAEALIRRWGIVKSSPPPHSGVG